MKSRPLRRTVKDTQPVLLKLLWAVACVALLSSLVATADAQNNNASNKNSDKNKKKKWEPFKVVKPRPEFGGRLAFSVTLSNPERQRVYVADLDNGSIERFSPVKGQYSYPSWSPDGKWLAYVGERDGKTEIYVSSWDKSKRIQVTDNGLRKGDPSWFPDSFNLVFYQSDGNDGRHTNLFSAERRWKQKPKRLTEFPEGRNTTPRISPDGKKIAYSTSRFWPGWDVCIWDLQKSIEKCPLNGDVSYCRPYWSIESPHLLYATGGGSDVEIGMFEEIGEYFVSLSHFPHREYDPVFGPDHQNVFFVSEGTKGKVFEVYWSRHNPQEPGRLLVSKLIESKFPIRVVSWAKHSTIDMEAMLIKEKQKSTSKKNRQ